LIYSFSPFAWSVYPVSFSAYFHLLVPILSNFSPYFQHPPKTDLQILVALTLHPIHLFSPYALQNLYFAISTDIYSNYSN
jgi:hypothetical protein